MSRKFVGLRVNFMNAQTGPKGRVRPVRGEEERRLLSGQSAFNSFAEKSKVIANLTPLLEEEDGSIVHLEPGDPENELVKVDYYELIIDGKSYRDGEIKDAIVDVNNHEANFGLTPRLVFGPGISGKHLVTFGASVNGHYDLADVSLRLDG